MMDNLRVELLLDDHRGIYIPQGFAEEWAHAFTYPDNPQGYADDVYTLTGGPHPPAWMSREQRYAYHDEQDEAWRRILDNAVGRKRLPHVPDGIFTLVHPDVDDPEWGAPNPWAGWRLDQGSAEDACVRMYHPNDYDAIFGEEG